MTKKNVFALSLVGTLLVVTSFLLFSTHTCYVNKACKEVSSILSQDNLTLIYILPFVFLFSLITYKMQEDVFQAWWRFARWFVPIIIAVTFLLNSAHQQSGFSGVAQGAFDFLILIVLYAIFIATSIVRIIIASWRLKNRK